MEKDIISLHLAGLGNNQIASKLDCPYNKVWGTLKKNNLNTSQSKWTSVTLTELEESIVVGTLLGDASVLYRTKLSRYPSFSVTHSSKAEAYLDYKYSLLGKNLRLKKCEITQKVKGKEYKAAQIYSPNLPCLKEYREKFYPNNIKIVPIEFIESKFTPLSLALLFMDDGTCDYRVTHSYYKIALDGLGYDEVVKFRDFLFRKFDLQTSVHKCGTLAIKAKSSDDFVDLIKPYMIDTMKYKLGGRQ